MQRRPVRRELLQAPTSHVLRTHFRPVLVAASHALAQNVLGAMLRDQPPVVVLTFRKASRRLLERLHVT